MSRVFVCKECGAVLENRGLLLTHYREVHRKAESNDKAQAAQATEEEPADEAPNHDPGVDLQVSEGGEMPHQPPATKRCSSCGREIQDDHTQVMRVEFFCSEACAADAESRRVVIPWGWLPPEMRVLSNGRPIVFRGVGLVNHHVGGIILTDFEVQ